VVRRLGAIHLREDRWHRSKDLVNLEVHRVRTQTLGAPSCKDVKSEKKDSHWIWVVRELLDRKPHRLSHTQGSEVERGHFQHQKLRSAESRGSCGHMAEP
jgi:hypothetical protein